MTMREKVARAIVDAEREFRGKEPISDTEWRNYWTPGGPAAMPSLIAMRADAVLLALREPDEGMVQAGMICADVSLASEFTAMIDAVLGDGK